MPSAGLEPATPATKRPQTYVLDRATTGINPGRVQSLNPGARHCSTCDWPADFRRLVACRKTRNSLKVQDISLETKSTSLSKLFYELRENIVSKIIIFYRLHFALLQPALDRRVFNTQKDVILLQLAAFISRENRHCSKKF
jgi:hypothetical protein